MTKILLGTPSYDGTVTEEYHHAVVELLLYMQKHRPDVVFDRRIVRNTLIDWARNWLASLVLFDPSYTHLLFVDADIGFRPRAIVKLLERNESVVGCAYPRRVLDIAEFHRMARLLDDPMTAFSAALGYPIESALEEGGAGFVRAGYLAAGLLLIQRKALELISERFPATTGDAAGSNYAALGDKVFQPFAPLRRPNGLWLTEDQAFCVRWRACGGDLWACIDEPIEHVGRFTFRGRYSDKPR